MDVDVDVVTAEDGHGFNISTSSTSSVCAPGYQEVMCSSCAPDFFSSGERCVKCPKASDLSATPTFIALVLALVLALGAVVWLWVRRPVQTQQPPSALSALMEQVKAQVPLLLQLCDLVMTFIFWEAVGSKLLCLFDLYFFHFFSKSKSFPFISKSTGEGQLWAVLAVLAGNTDGKSSERSPFWELPYVQTIQFSVSSLKGAFNLQCRFEAWAEIFEQRRNFYNINLIRHSRNNSYSDGWCLMCSRCWYWNLLFKETFDQAKQISFLSQTKQNRISWANTWRFVLIFCCHISFLRMVPLCALSPPWWRQCFHWLSSSVACWWKSPSLDWASLVGCRTLDVWVFQMDEGRREHVSMDLSVV